MDSMDSKNRNQGFTLLPATSSKTTRMNSQLDIYYSLKNKDFCFNYLVKPIINPNGLRRLGIKEKKQSSFLFVTF